MDRKIKNGILRSDTALKSIETELRRSIYSQVDSFGSFASVGISTIIYSEKGKLHIDSDKLKTALETDLQNTLALFLNKSNVSFSHYASPEQQETRFNESGVLHRLSDIIQKNLNSVGKKGALITLVGSPNSAYVSDTEYSKRIKSLDDKISNLEDKLKAEEDRYWKQFTAMETALSKLYSQSAYIDSMFNSNK